MHTRLQSSRSLSLHCFRPPFTDTGQYEPCVSTHSVTGTFVGMFVGTLVGAFVGATVAFVGAWVTGVPGLRQ